MNRYLQANNLIPDFKNMLDSGEINLSTVEYFTGFSTEIQKEIYDALVAKGEKINREKAKEVRDGVNEVIKTIDEMEKNIMKASQQPQK